MRVIIVGCGYVGGELLRRLRAAGRDALGVRRSASEGCLSANVLDLSSLRRALPAGPADLVYAVSPNERSDEGYERAYVSGLKNALSAVDARRVVLVSSSGVVPASGGAWVDEKTPITLDERASFSARRLREGERVALGRGGSVLRLTGIYGPGRDRLLRSVASGDARIPKETLYTNRIHRDDAAAMAAHLLELPRPAPVYFGTDTVAATYAEVLTFIAGELGVPVPPEGPASRRSNKRVSGAAMVRSGFRHRFPTYREGYAAMIAERREEYARLADEAANR
ncbi:MAG: NAD-dependent epimerase/dehydratase family protein [Myxococcota bacterium]